MATTNELEVCGQAELTAFKAALCEAGRPDIADWGWEVGKNAFWATGFGAWTWSQLDAPTAEVVFRAVTLAHILHDRRAHWWRNDDGGQVVCCPTCAAAALTPGWEPCPTHPL